MLFEGGTYSAHSIVGHTTIHTRYLYRHHANAAYRFLYMATTCSLFLDMIAFSFPIRVLHVLEHGGV